MESLNKVYIERGFTMTTFRALVVNKGDSTFSVSVEELHLNELPVGEILIRVSYSSINYKDGLACNPNGRIVKNYPFVPGIDLAGIVVDSTDTRFNEGDPVLVTGYDLGVSHFGGFSEFARVPADWVVPLPNNLTLREAMIIGTAGFTAALSVQSLEEHNITPVQGPILVTGATGGVGSTAVAILAKRGFDVVASTGKESEYGYLRELGAKEILSREDVSPEKIKPIDKQRWAGVIDPVGGNILAYALSTTQYGGTIAVSGLTGGANLSTTVFPFILRGVNLIGIDSVYCSMNKRRKIWNRLSSDFKPEQLSSMVYGEIKLDEIEETAKKIQEGKIRGRVLVKL